VLAGALRAGMETTDREERTDGREEARFGVARAERQRLAAPNDDDEAGDGFGNKSLDTQSRNF